MNRYEKLFGNKKIVVGMVHLLPLPGSVGFCGDLDKVYKAAEKDLKALIEGGCNAVIIENFGDVPYAQNNSLIAVTSFAVIATKLRKLTKLPMGINFQYNDIEAEWALAYACGYDFIRVEVLAENRCGPNGILEAAGPKLMRIRAQYPKDIVILADVNVKHTFPLTDQPLDFTIESCIEGGADALILTGITTGKSPSVEDALNFKKMAHNMPVFVGSGVNKDNAKEFFEIIDGAIVGSSFKKGGNVNNPVDLLRVKTFIKQLSK
ncbi:MAG: BtpA/SgcQ family protein [Erysipelotrichaceae bacterium]|nr:BtpA/SgcQ family protein [Erysipelotrichaceae bacterium]